MGETSHTPVIRTCFIAAPAGVEIGGLQESLAARGIRLVVPKRLSAGTDWSTQVQSAIRRADLVVGVVMRDRPMESVLFELGMAAALNRRLLLIAPMGADLPSPLESFLTLRVELTDMEAINFALDQVETAPRRPVKSKARKAPRSRGLGSQVNDLARQLDAILQSRDVGHLESLVSEAISSPGVDVVAESRSSDEGFDLAVWADVLEPFVGNPLLIQLKLRLPVSGVEQVISEFGNCVADSGSRWGLLLYAEGQGYSWTSRGRLDVPSNVLVMSVHDLLEGLRTATFPEIVRDIRNQRVHGVGR